MRVLAERLDVLRERFDAQWKTLTSKIRIPPERMTVDRSFGNPTGASIPITLDRAVRAGRLRAGDVAFLCAFGAGFSWAWSVLRW